MLRASVVPHRQAIDLPVHTALQLDVVGDMVKQKLQNSLALTPGNAFDLVGKPGVHVQRLAPGIGVRITGCRFTGCSLSDLLL